MTEPTNIPPQGASAELKFFWIEEGTEFGSTGHYFAWRPEAESISFSRLTIREGLMIGVEEAWPENHLVPAIATLENGLHKRVKRDPDNRGGIRICYSKSGRGAVIRGVVARKEGGAYDLYLPERKAEQSNPPPRKKPTLFISYAHEDEELRNRLCVHLGSLIRDGVIKTWHDREMLGGDEFNNVIPEKMKESAILLLLISADFINSSFCMDIELPIALELHNSKRARCVPILLRHCDWKGKPFAHLNSFLDFKLPVTRWEDREEAFNEIMKGIRAILAASE